MEDDARRALDEARADCEPSLLRYAYLLCGNLNDAQDLVQEAFLALAKRGGSMPAIDHVDRYAMRTIRNLYVTQVRRAELFQRLIPKIHRAEVEIQYDDQDASASRDQLWRALRQLKPNQRCALVLRYYLDRSDAEIAEVLACSPSTARSHLARGLAEMRKRWDFENTQGPNSQTTGR